ncbi:MAG TPA: two-component regulator propeller domain-containing protein, partial [Rheinheimera sp.]|nr:two-component regulator propeller domain-containing protein [Rheinheimera sp.]
MSEEQYLYRVWSVEAGLPQISVTAIVQDTEGFLWVGTQNGLARFDGVTFRVFNTANTPEISSNLITELFLDDQERLWIGSVNGLIRYQQGKF